MKVVNLSHNEIKSYLKSVFSDSNFNSMGKIAIVSIATGGVKIGKLLEDLLTEKSNSSISSITVKCQRPSTNLKKKSPIREFLLKKVFRVTPYYVLNRLRILEHKKLLKVASQARTISTDKSFDLLCTADTVFIIDDAIDSGYSFSAVYNHVQTFKLKNRLNFQTISLCIAVTQEDPAFSPDFYMVKDALVRFPWSMDSKDAYF